MVPKGIRTRATSDWFAQFMALGGLSISIDSGLFDFQSIALYNDSNDGASLFVWAVSAVTDDSEYLDTAFLNGTFGTFQRGCTRINPTQGAPAGQIYYSHDPTNPIAITPTGSYILNLANPMGGVGPLYIIPPSWSLVFATTRKGAMFSLTAWYMPMIDVKGYKPV